ncbi:MAG: histidine kinase [Candidatus Reconcilbacillus cellulovorans]|uniref:histidine kinase n=1 Tax=Candidatus Reconcilbacillus cellulovorans TaxID=1906605 RepID=A0A2A6E0A1_9BACL|nr:MAG: histidine kinase [Candidatus Reconcilbacillus cellulovorans]
MRKGRLPAVVRRPAGIQFAITASFSLVCLSVVFAVGFIVYDRFAQSAEHNAKLHNEQIVEQVLFNLTSYLRDMNDLFEAADDMLRRGKDLPDAELASRLGTILDTREDVVSLALFTLDGRAAVVVPAAPLRANTRLTEQKWFRSAVEHPPYMFFSPPHIQNLYKGEYKWVVSMSRNVTVERNGRIVAGVLLVDFNFRTIDALCQQVRLGEKGYVYVTDSAGNLVYHPELQLINNGLKRESSVERAFALYHGSYIDESGGDRRLITVRTVPNIGWRVVGVSYMDELVTTKREFGAFLSVLFAAVMLLVLPVSAYLSAKIVQPLKRLERSMARVEKGDFDIWLDIRAGGEVGRLSRRFNLMVSRIRELMEQIIREQEEKRKREFEVLQAQINPHFLYNALNAVVRLVESGNKEAAVTTITSLSRLFRISLSQGKTVIPVRDELEHVRHYLTIQSIRYKNKFAFEIAADPSVLDLWTPKLILQPIVENAVQHGIEPMVDPGKIEVVARPDDGRLLFEVRDNGVGMSREKVSGLLSGAATGANGTGVGLKNVHERIRLLFGEPYGVEIDSEPDEGTVVRIRLPILDEAKAGDKT